MFAWSSDGRRATRVLLEDNLTFKDQVLIPIRVLKAFSGSEDPEKWLYAGSLFWFVWKDRRIWTRLLEAQFPPLDKIFKTARELAAKAPGFEHDCEELVRAINVAASAGGVGITGELENKKLTLVGQGDLSEMKITVDLKKSRGKSKFFVQQEFLRTAMSRFPKVGISDQGALYFINPADRSEHVVMQLVKETVREHEEQKEEEAPF
jgi:hypothetical protein